MPRVLGILSLVAVRLSVPGALPLAAPFFLSVLEVAHIEGSRGPDVLSLSLWLPVFVLAGVGVSADERVGSLAFLQTKVPFAFVPISVRPCMDTIPVRPTLMPLANVRVVLDSLPDAVAML